MVKGIKSTWEQWVLIKSKKENIDVTQEELQYSPNGQWSLRKAHMFIPDHWAGEFKAEQEAKQKGLPSPKVIDNNKSELSHMYHGLNNAVQGGDQAEIEKHKQIIRDHVANAPKGSIDIGHLGELHEMQARMDHQTPHGNTYSGKAMNDHELAEMINPHIEDAKDLKEIHDKHGDAGLRTLMRIHGANGEIYHDYHALKFKDHTPMSELIDAVAPGKASRQYDPNGNEFSHTSDHLSSDWDEKLHKRVADTWDAMYGEDVEDVWDGSPESNQLIKDHEEAVFDRGIEHLKHHWGKTS